MKTAAANQSSMKFYRMAAGKKLDRKHLTPAAPEIGGMIYSPIFSSLDGRLGAKARWCTKSKPMGIVVYLLNFFSNLEVWHLS
jgi:hypothetical protein